eukprot:scaffold228284_cov36-Tisochrysis_lutea.AAC.2
MDAFRAGVSGLDPPRAAWRQCGTCGPHTRRVSYSGGSSAMGGSAGAGARQSGPTPLAVGEEGDGPPTDAQWPARTGRGRALVRACGRRLHEAVMRSLPSWRRSSSCGCRHLA